MEPSHDEAGPLAGVKVLELGQLLAGPWAGTILGYFGAEVTKVEAPGGDPIRTWRLLDEGGTSYWWRSIARNKTCVEEDLRSEGGRARVRALAMEPRIMLFDEITSALDPELVGEVLDVLRQLQRQGMTMIIATHEMKFAAEAAHKVCFLHEGRILEEGPPERLFSAPREARTRAFLARVV